jgi:hypothetical protein
MGIKEFKNSAPKKGGNEKNKKYAKKSSFSTYVIIGALAIGLGGAYLLTGTGSRGTTIDYDSIKDVSELREWEMNPILSSQRFLGVASRAYKVAAEIPDVMDSLYCYCNCMIHSGHKSLKTCYTNEHGANCGICIDQALRAYELHKEGKDILTIRKIIDKEFA